MSKEEKFTAEQVERIVLNVTKDIAIRILKRIESSESIAKNEALHYVDNNEESYKYSSLKYSSIADELQSLKSEITKSKYYSKTSYFLY